ncbi:SIS domain-containing protein [Staphylococcus aureus]
MSDYQLLTEKMHTASTIYLYGTGRAQLNVASEAQRILLTLHNHVIVLHDEHELKMILNKSEPNDLFFIISLSGETHELLEVTNLLQLKQKYFISVTTMKIIPLLKKQITTSMYPVTHST